MDITLLAKVTWTCNMNALNLKSIGIHSLQTALSQSALRYKDKWNTCSHDQVNPDGTIFKKQ